MCLQILVHKECHETDLSLLIFNFLLPQKKHHLNPLELTKKQRVC